MCTELANEAVMHSETHAEGLDKIPVLEEQVRVKEAEIRELSKRLADIQAIGNARDDESLLSSKITAALEEQVHAYTLSQRNMNHGHAPKRLFSAAHQHHSLTNTTFTVHQHHIHFR